VLGLPVRCAQPGELRGWLTSCVRRPIPPESACCTGLGFRKNNRHSMAAALDDSPCPVWT